MKESHPDVVTGLKRRGFWMVLETGEGNKNYILLLQMSGGLNLRRSSILVL